VLIISPYQTTNLNNHLIIKIKPAICDYIGSFQTQIFVFVWFEIQIYEKAKYLNMISFCGKFMNNNCHNMKKIDGAAGLQALQHMNYSLLQQILLKHFIKTYLTSKECNYGVC